ncbi:MAG: O-fucosyltransferase family protein [Burkholderiales bacterium]
MRFLLIKSWGYSLWADIEHVMGQLLVAEITGRIPVVYWGMESMYSDSLNSNAFELFFEPVSEYTVNDVVHPSFTYYPPLWNFNNVMLEDPDRLRWKDRDLKGMISSGADVVVSDVYYHVNSILPWITPGSTYYGKTTHQIYRMLYDKYLKVKPEIRKRVTHFIHANPSFRDEKPIVGVHVCGNALVNEGNQLYSNNDFYHPNIWQYFHKYNARHVFLITDSKRIVHEYKRQYGFKDVLILSDSRKEGFRGPVRQCNTDFPNKRRKGVELIKDTFDIIKDTYLALECDFFIGNGYSSLSNAVMRLKDWPETNIKLLY